MATENIPTCYDYTNQAWVVEGKYVRCGHPDHMKCDCYGKLHEGEIPAPEVELHDHR